MSHTFTNPRNTERTTTGKNFDFVFSGAGGKKKLGFLLLL